MNSMPFKHDTIPDPSGLVVISSQTNNRILSYNCTLCNKEYPIVNDSIEAPRRNFLKHAKSNSHSCRLILVQSLNRTSQNQSFGLSTKSQTDSHLTDSHLTPSVSTIDADLFSTSHNNNSSDDHTRCYSPRIIFTSFDPHVDEEKYRFYHYHQE
jgi:hypothetical protein